ncbi:hypothetical protein DENSPDRAFT_861953 [Dentipellis sp. KUC8613]|nr:hypothetical protein DENSPDRAFT_861953 [Dentipellis sp. KUC8613]
MSRGNRVVTAGNLSTSMRDNYKEHGYYVKVGSTYRNPHYPGVRRCLFSWFTSWWLKEATNVDQTEIAVFDMACASGEVTAALQEWWRQGLAASVQTPTEISSSDNLPSLPIPRRSTTIVPLPGFGPETPRPWIMAADPYTMKAYEVRAGLPCAALSFRDIACGALPDTMHRLPLQNPTRDSSGRPAPDTLTEPRERVEMVICSFALHLVESASELFALLWELSTKCRWLVILAPHKKPEIKNGWGWIKWDVNNWSEGSMQGAQGEILHDRVHCRIYRSLNLP